MAFYLAKASARHEEAHASGFTLGVNPHDFTHETADGKTIEDAYIVFGLISK
jgi:hypothetical protein